MLSLERHWPLIGGGHAYLPRGPVTAGDEPAAVAQRLAAATDYLRARRLDSVASDPEIDADSGYAEAIRALGFSQAEELQPSRHRMALELGAGLDAERQFGALSMSARQRVRKALKAGHRVFDWDVAPGPDDESLVELRRDEAADPQRLATVVARFYDVIAGTASRRHFRLVAAERFVRWATLAIGSGLGFLLEVRSPDDELLGGGLFHRHGGRLTYFIAGDQADLRRQHPGVMHLLVWRAIELAIAQRMAEVDLGGADVAGARRRPQAGDEMHGVMAFKESFGCRWLELAGNHERRLRPAHYAVGRVLERAIGGHAASEPLVPAAHEATT